jgi:hypothetical protein
MASHTIEEKMRKKRVKKRDTGKQTEKSELSLKVFLEEIEKIRKALNEKGVKRDILACLLKD